MVDGVGDEAGNGGQTSSFLPVRRGASAEPSFLTLLGLSLRRPGGRRVVRVVSVLLMLAGVSMFAFPAFTDLVHAYRQKHVTADFSDPTYRADYLAHKIKVGQGLTRLVIRNDRVHVNVLVVEGTTLAALQAGAGHYADTPLPCERGNVAIAGHRTTYGRPFNKIDEMRRGDRVDLITPFARCIYQVVPGFGGHPDPWVVLPDDYAVVGQQGRLGAGHWLTLTSCHPEGSDSHRIVLRLRLVRTVALPAPRSG